ncbi:hypothetical protein SBV1_410110 [Verrucomicrobia bacterium]|nr:hypothetical protein SBV1_410110 [Verrucomicrobiota bacterium]
MWRPEFPGSFPEQSEVARAKSEAAFKTLKSDLQLPPVRHHVEERIEAHIRVSFTLTLSGNGRSPSIP